MDHLQLQSNSNNSHIPESSKDIPRKLWKNNCITGNNPIF